MYCAEKTRIVFQIGKFGDIAALARNLGGRLTIKYLHCLTWFNHACSAVGQIVNHNTNGIYSGT